MDLDEVGVPMMVALTQTIPELVTRFNIDKLQARVRKGAKRLDGAHAVLSGDRRTALALCEPCRRPVLKVGDTVERYLQSGDWVVFNRQPSLHKGSMMGHRARIMPIGRSFRLPVPDTSPYNADFDGDEMNLHVPQTLEARAEVQHLMGVTKQIVSPQANAPIIGCIQDVLLGAWRLTSQNTFLEQGRFFDLTMEVHFADRPVPEPAIYDLRGDRPRKLFTGAQTMSYLLPPITYSSGNDPFGGDTIIEDGEFMSGRLNKKALGKSAGGIVHLTTLDVGPKRAMEFLSDIQRLVCVYMQGTGETIGLGDCLVDAATHDKIHQAVTGIVDAVKREFPHGPKNESEEMSVTRTLNSALDEAGQIVLKAMDRDNGFKACVDSGSKGSKINLAQVSGCVGQVCVTGKRILPPPVAELFHATPPTTTTSFPMGSARTLTC